MARRLSPTAVRNTGLLKRFGTLRDQDLTPVSDATELDCRIGNSVGANNTAMPTEIHVDAAELKASENDADNANVSFGESSLTSSENDGEDRPPTSSVIPDVVDMNRNQSNHIVHAQRKSTDDIEDEDTFSHNLEVARNNMSQQDRERVDKRMERVTFLDNPDNTANCYGGESSQTKGKAIDPRNWGEVQLDEAEMDPQIQGEILTEYNTRLEVENHPSTPEPEVDDTTHDVLNVEGSEDYPHEEMGDNDNDQPEVSCEELREYLRNKRKLERKMDQLRKKDRTSHKKRKERASSEPVSQELAALIQKVAEGSKRKSKYKKDGDKKPYNLND